MINLLLYWMSYLCIEALKISIVVIDVFNFKFRKRMVQIVVLLVSFSVTISCLMYKYGQQKYQLLIIVFLLFYVEICFKSKHKLLMTAVSYFLICINDMLFSSIALAFMRTGIDAINNNYLLTIGFELANLIILLALDVLYGIIFKKNKMIFDRPIDRKYYIICICSILCIVLYIAPIQLFLVNYRENKLKNIIIVASSISGCFFLIVIISLIISEYSKNYYRSMCEFNQELLLRQQNYYLSILEKDKSTKKFRHDINNHIICIKHLCERGRYDELMTYISDIEDALRPMMGGICTGNEIVDVIVGDLKAKYMDCGVELEWKGMLPENIGISLMDLCTIFSNLLNNAYEAATKSEQNKKIEVKIREHYNFVVINIINAKNGQVYINNNVLVTTKLNKDLHGLGSINVKECVERNKGIIKYICTKDEFKVEVLLENNVKL